MAWFRFSNKRVQVPILLDSGTGSVRRSLAYSAGGNYIGLILQFGTTIVLSRLLTPTELGVFAVAAVFSSLALTVRDFGLGEYLVQKSDLNEQDLRSAITFSLLLSWSLGIMLWLTAPWLAAYFREPGVGEVLRVLALAFALIPFGAVTMAWYRRQLILRPLFVASLASSFTSFVVSISCAWAGMRYMSLAWASVAGVLATVLVSAWFRPNDLPRKPGLQGLRSALEFGRSTVLVNLASQLGRRAPEILIGRLQSLEAVAMFGRAGALVELFQRLVVRSVQPLALPVFAQCQRDHGSPASAYLNSMTLLTLTGWPVLGYLALVAPTAIGLAYGPQWSDAIEPSRILCAMAAVELLHRFSREVLLSQARRQLANALSLAQLALRFAGLLAVIPGGLEGACWGLLASSVLGAALQHAVLSRTLGLAHGEVLRSCVVNLGVAMASCAPLALWMGLQGSANARTGITAFVGAIVTAGAWYLCLRAMHLPLLVEVHRLFRWVQRAAH